MPPERVAIVTGANKGIGLAIVRQLALQYANSPLSKQTPGSPLLVYLTARDQSRGEAALESIHNDASLAKARALATPNGQGGGGAVTVKYHALDISKAQSVSALSQFLREEHPDGVDIVVNNAGVALDGYTPEIVASTLQLNYYATLSAIQTFLPHIRPGGRLINVASAIGHLSRYSPQLQRRFREAKTHAEITALMDEFKAAVVRGSEKEEGWPTSAYAVSKAGVIGMTRAVAREHSEGGGKVLINCVCPGYVNTDMTKGRGVKTPDQGAQTPVQLALSDIGGRTGLYWSDGKPGDW